MKITRDNLRVSDFWRRADIALPIFDLEAAARAAEEAPEWVHFGAGNIFRAFPAALWQKLLEAGLARAGLIVAEGYDYEIIDQAFTANDGLTLLVTLKADGGLEKKIIASVTHAFKADSENAGDFAALAAIFAKPSLTMASFTITEKGYSLTKAGGSLAPEVAADFTKGPARPRSYLGKVAALVYRRFKAGRLPLALVSLDNCAHNGDRLHQAVSAFAEAWANAGLAERGFADYLNDESLVSFPWSMIDKITPRPDEAVREGLAQLGLEGLEGRVTARQTFVAPFVNAEETEYLVVEDWFPAGRPPLEKAGVLFADRLTVDKVEKMKVCTCLNPLHTALAVFGCLLGFTKISDEMKDPDLLALVRRVGYVEGLPVAVSPGILDPREFLDAVITRRLPNPFLPDAPQRIAADTSQKLPIRFGETIKAYRREGRDLGELSGVSLVLAGWCRYLMGVDDEGRAFAPSPDPLYDELAPHLKKAALGQKSPGREALEPILSRAAIFGLDLYETCLGERVEKLFAEMVEGGSGSVRRTLKKHLS